MEKVYKTFCPIVNAAVDFPSLGCYGCIRPTPQYRLCRPAKVVKINFETRMVTIDFSFFLSLCSAWLQKHSFLLKHWYLQTCLELEPIWRLREYAVAVKPYKQLGLARVEAQSWRWIFPQYICIHFRKKVQPYVPSTPVLYLGMDDDNGKKDDNNNNNNYDNDNNNR